MRLIDADLQLIRVSSRIESVQFNKLRRRSGETPMRDVNSGFPDPSSLLFSTLFSCLFASRLSGGCLRLERLQEIRKVYAGISIGFCFGQVRSLLLSFVRTINLFIFLRITEAYLKFLEPPPLFNFSNGKNISWRVVL